MKNKLYTSINEFKQALKVQLINEGQFSWFTQDTDTQIGNMTENQITVYMHDNKGNVWKEDSYDGYGEFGGKDYFEVLAEMNGLEADRSKGIDLAFSGNSNVLFPALVGDPNYDISNHDFTKEPESDPNQGWIMEEEDDVDYDDDEDYYENKKIDNEDLKDLNLNERDINLVRRGLNAELNLKELIKLYNSFEDVNYHTVSKSLYKVIEHLKSDNKVAAIDALDAFKNDLDEEAAFGFNIDKNNMNENNENIKSLLVFVYKSGLGDSTANGLTSKKDQLMLVTDGETGAFNVDDEEDYLVLKKKNISGEYLYAVPKSIIDSGEHSMMGGNFVYSSDARFPNQYPIPVHDRVE